MEVVPDYVTRYTDLIVLPNRQPAKVISPDVRLRNRPGFEVDFITRGSIFESRQTCDIPEGSSHSLRPNATGEAGMYRVRTNDPAGKTMPLN